MPKRPKDFCIDDGCFVCQVDIKDPKTKWRTNLPVQEVDGSSIKEYYDQWKKKLAYPAQVT